VADSFRNRYVRQLYPCTYAAQHQPATAHVPSTDKLGREYQPFAKYSQQGIDVFGSSNAAQKNDLATRSDKLRDHSCVAFERLTVSRVTRLYGDCHHLLQFAQAYRLFRRHKPAARGDDEGSGCSRRGFGERLGVGQLATEVKSADEAEQLT
jgi:hypothetical protein